MTTDGVASAIVGDARLSASGKRLMMASYLARLAGIEVPATEAPADIQRLRAWALSSGWYARAASALAQSITPCPPECVADHDEDRSFHYSRPVTVAEGLSTTVRLSWQDGRALVQLGNEDLTPQQARDVAALLVQHADRGEHGTPLPNWQCRNGEHDHGDGAR